MKYRFETERMDYAHYASGKIFHAAPGYPAFPVRLAAEIFQRCLAYREKLGESGRCKLYDPCCGAAYLLSTLASIHWNSIGQVIGSDVDARALVVAARNLSLLTLKGMDQRIAEVSALVATYGKPSHAEALVSSQALRERLQANLNSHSIGARLFQADVLDPAAVVRGIGQAGADIVITDLPYGQMSNWRLDSDHGEPINNPIQGMLSALLPVLSDRAILAVVGNKQDEIRSDRYQQLGRTKLGKRQIVFLTPGQ